MQDMYKTHFSLYFSFFPFFVLFSFLFLVCFFKTGKKTKAYFFNMVMQVGGKTSFVVIQSDDVTPKYRGESRPSVHNHLVIGKRLLIALQWLRYTVRKAPVVAGADSL